MRRRRGLGKSKMRKGCLRCKTENKPGSLVRLEGVVKKSRKAFSRRTRGGKRVEISRGKCRHSVMMLVEMEA